MVSAINGFLSKAGRFISRTAEFDMKGKDAHSQVLRYGAAASYSLLSVGQAASFALSKNIPDKEKNFLIPQQLAEGGITIAMYLLLTKYFRMAGEKLVEKAKILPDIIPENLRNSKSIQDLLKFNSEHSETIKKTMGGLGFATQIAGGIVALQIFTPIIRNKIASFFQKRTIKSETVDQQQTGKIAQLTKTVYKDFINWQNPPKNKN